MDEERKVYDEELKITPGTIVRTVVLAVAIVNQVLTWLGKPIIPIDNAKLAELVALVWGIAAAIVAWWKNNSFTLPALAGDVVMRLMRSGKTSGEVRLADEEDEEEK